MGALAVICHEYEYVTVTGSFLPFDAYTQLSGSVSTKLTGSGAGYTGDLDNDGRADVIHNKGGKWHISYARPIANSNALDFIQYNTQIPASNSQYARVIDINSDGRVEFVFAKDGHWSYIDVPYTLSSGSLHPYQHLTSYSGDEYTNSTFIDVNGDSFVDLVYNKANSTDLYVKYNYAGNFSSEQALTSGQILSDKISNYATTPTPGLKNSAFIDFNGDGISDLLVKGAQYYYACVYYDYYGVKRTYRSGGDLATLTADCNSIVGTIINNNYVRYSEITNLYNRREALLIGSAEIENGKAVGKYSSQIFLHFLTGVDIKTEVRIVDFNGDGLSDIVYLKNDAWHYALSKGDGTFVEGDIPAYVLTGNYANRNNAHRFLDLNNDGKTDILSAGTTRYDVSLVKTLPNGNIAFVGADDTVIDYSGDFVHIDDFDGDSKLDVMHKSNHLSYVYFSPGRHNKTKSNAIEHIDFGFGQRTSISYEPIQYDNNQDLEYTINSEIKLVPYPNLPNERPATDLNFTDNAYDSDYLSVKTRMWVVNSVQNNVYDNNDNEVKNLTVEYRYTGMLMHKLGYGSSGFQRVQTIDSQTGVITTTRYDQHYPNVGLPISTEVALNGKILSFAQNILDTNSANTDGLHPYIKTSHEKKWHSHSDGTRSFASYTKSTFDYDAYGNLSTSEVINYADVDGTQALKTTETVNEYNGAGGGAAMGRLSKTDVTHTDKNNVSSTLTSTFTYYSDGLLESSQVNGLNLKTTYFYTPLGNKQKECQKDTITTQQRCNIIHWSTDERYVDSVENALGHTETYLYNGLPADSVTGRIGTKATTSANGIVSVQHFDLQGQVIKAVRADGNETRITRDFANSTNLDNCVANNEHLCFYEKTEGDGQPTSYVWYDAYGRKVKTQVQAFDGSNWSSQYMTYDEYSRNKSTSIAYFDNSPNGNKPASVAKASYDYDSFGRVTTETMANGSVNSREYQGYTTKYTDANLKTRFEESNALGQLTQVRSTAFNTYENGQEYSGVINYIDNHYDVFGKLTQVDTYSSIDTNKKSSIHNIYDEHGRKKYMRDPDKGYWQYEYNAFGELTSQTNSNNITSYFDYDKLGRKSRSKTDDYQNYGAKLTCYTYGNSQAAHNVGQLTHVKLIRTTDGPLNSSDCASSTTLASNAIEWQQIHQFDVYGRPESTQTIITHENGSFNTYKQSSTYDDYGRVATQKHPEGLKTTNHYENNYLKKITYGDNRLIREIVTKNAAGQITREKMGENISRDNAFYETTGLIQSISVEQDSTNQKIHELTYNFDNLGNLKDREHFYSNTEYFFEEFTYDNLYRLTTRQLTQQSGIAFEDGLSYNQHYRYDTRGNLTQKYSIHNSTSAQLLKHDYHYSWQTHGQTNSTYPLIRNRLNSINKDGNASFRSYQYDNSGNVKNDGKNTFKYTSFDKPHKITGSHGELSHFWYDSSNSRYKRYDKIQEINPTTNAPYAELTIYNTLYVGAFERNKRVGGAGDRTEYKYHIADLILTRDSTETTYKESFSHTDAQGSVISITDTQGNVAEQFLYDPWGKQQKVEISTTVAGHVSSIIRGTATTRGYTGHEEISHLGLIHMNGRVYDPTVGRFLQADPFVQYANNSQSYNRYSYVLNNPMSFTDPSGYFSLNPFKRAKKLLRSIAKIPILNMAVHVVLNLIPGCQGWCSAVYAAASTYAVTGDLNKAFTAGIVSAISPMSGNYLTSALIGGLASKAQGGNFGHGFWAAGLGAALGGRVNTGNAYVNVVVSSVIGGTVSQLTGGKFSNGAQTWAFSAAMAQNWGNNQGDIEGYDILGKGEKVILGDSDNHGKAMSLYEGKVLFAKWGDKDARLTFEEMGTVKSDLKDIFSTKNGELLLNTLSKDQPLKILLNNEGANGGTKLARVLTVDLKTKTYFNNLIWN